MIMSGANTGRPWRSRFFAEVRQTKTAPTETVGLAIPDGDLACDTCCPLDPFPSDIDALCYVASHPDLIEVLGDDANKARLHYQTKGRLEGRAIMFDPLRYVASHSDLFMFGTDRTAACRHFIRHGYREVRPITFDPFAYLAANPDLIASVPADEEHILQHYIKIGHAEGRRSHAFPWKQYLELNTGVSDAIGCTYEAAVKHYVREGYAEGRRVS